MRRRPSPDLRRAGVGVRVPHDRAVRPARAVSELLFGVASLLTPFFMGTVVGAIAGGRVPVGNAAGDAVTSWLNPLSLVIGALFVATSAYLSAVLPRKRRPGAGAPRPRALLQHARADHRRSRRLLDEAPLDEREEQGD